MTNMFRDELEKRLGELTTTIGERNALQGVVEELNHQMGVLKDTLARQEVGGGLLQRTYPLKPSLTPSTTYYLTTLLHFNPAMLLYYYS